MSNGSAYFPHPQLPNHQPKAMASNNVNIKSFYFHLRMEFIF